MPRTLRLAITTLALAATLTTIPSLGSPAVAEAQGGVRYIRSPHEGRRPLQLEVHGGVSWFGLGLATGVRFGIPLLRNGFIPRLNNAVYLNFGGDFYWVNCPGNSCDGRSYGAAVGVPVTVHWEFYFTPKASLFAEVGGQVFLHQRFIAGEPFDVYDPGYWVVAAVGANFRVHRNVALTARLGTPYTSFGVTFEF